MNIKIDGAKGIGYNLKILKILTFLGIITNTTLLFITKDFAFLELKWPLLFSIENILLFLFFILSYRYVPAWFDYIDQIRYGYVLSVMKNDIYDNDGNIVSSNTITS